MTENSYIPTDGSESENPFHHALLQCFDRGCSVEDVQKILSKPSS